MKIGNRLVSIDFEFTGVAEEKLDLICCSFKLQDTKETFEYWLHNTDKRSLVSHIERLHEQGYVFLAHNVVAEASAFYSLGLKPQTFKWIDTFAEFVADYRKEILTYLKVGNTNMVKTLLEGDTLKPEPKPEPKK